MNTPSSQWLDGAGAVSHPDGKFIVYWSRDFGNVWARIIEADGTMPGPEVSLPSTPGTQYPGALGVFGSGEIVAAWMKRLGGGLYRIEERRFDRLLAPLGVETDVSETSFTSGGDSSVALAVGGSRYVVAWTGGGAAAGDVYARFFDQATGPLGPQLIVNTYTSDTQAEPYCAMDAQGRALVVYWSYNQDGASLGVFARRFDSQGSPLAPEFPVNMTTWNPQIAAGVAMLPSGDFVVAFSSETGAPIASDVFIRRFFFPVSLVVAPGPGAGNPARVETRQPDGQPGGVVVLPYASGNYGAEVGAGDVDGDAYADILTGPGPSPAFGPHVRAYRRDATAISKVSFYAYGTLRYGVKPAGANLDADAFSEIVTTPGPGYVFGPHVRGFGYDSATVTALSKVNFYAFSTLRYGANSAGGDVDGDGYEEILAGPGPGPAFGSQVRGFDVDGGGVSPIANVDELVFPGYYYGVNVGAADYETTGTGFYGDRYDEILVAKGPGVGNDTDFALWNWDGIPSPMSNWHTVDASYGPLLYGLRIAGGDVDAGDMEEIVTVPGPDPAAAARVRCWELNPLLGTNPDAPEIDAIGADDFDAFQGLGLAYGGTVSVGPFE